MGNKSSTDLLSGAIGDLWKNGSGGNAPAQPQQQTNIFGVADTGNLFGINQGQGLNEGSLSSNNIFGVKDTGDIFGLTGKQSTPPSQGTVEQGPLGQRATLPSTQGQRNKLNLVNLGGKQYVLIEDYRYSQKEGRYKPSTRLMLYEEWIRKNKEEGVVPTPMQSTGLQGTPQSQSILGAGPGIGFGKASTYQKAGNLPTQRPSSMMGKAGIPAASFADKQYEQALRRIDLANKRTEAILKRQGVQTARYKSDQERANYYEKLLKSGLSVKTSPLDYLYGGQKRIKDASGKDVIVRTGGIPGAAREARAASKELAGEARTIGREAKEMFGPAAKGVAGISKSIGKAIDDRALKGKIGKRLSRYEKPNEALKHISKDAGMFFNKKELQEQIDKANEIYG